MKMGDLKPVVFRGDALETLLAFPASARREAGYQLGKVQNGMEPNDWKPMPGIGKGVREIRIHDASGAFQVVYATRLPEAVYVLHCFQKKTRRTSKTDVDMAAKRYRDLMGDRAR